MESYNFVLLASALAFAVAGSYIVWGPSYRTKRKQNVPGLQNLGNSCFLNAVLQALAACPLFIHWLLDVVNNKNDLQRLSASLLAILRDLNLNSGLFSPTSVVDSLRQLRWVITNEEQDAHELFHVLTTTLEEEQLTPDPPVLSLLDISKLPDAPKNMDKFFNKSKSGLLPFEIRKAALPFRGLLANQMICTKCKYKYPVKYDTFDSVSLSIPALHFGPLKLQDCLKKFISREQVTDVSCDKCAEKLKVSNCEELESPMPKTTFLKQLSFGKLPECLCFHIKRTVWLNNGMPTKCYKHIEFPEVLSMDGYTYLNLKKQKVEVDELEAKLIGGSSSKQEASPQRALLPLLDPESLQNFPQTLSGSLNLLSDTKLLPGSHLYVLKSVLVHLGDTFSGHFVTYRRGPQKSSKYSKKWFRTSDSETKEVEFHEVMRACAYMIFYEKMLSHKL